MEHHQAVEALSALAHPLRLAIYRQLVQAGQEGVMPGALSQQLQIPNSTLSFHLKTLSQAGLVLASPEGRAIHYRADYDSMRTLLGYLTDNCCAGAHTCGEAWPHITCTQEMK